MVKSPKFMLIVPFKSKKHEEWLVVASASVRCILFIILGEVQTLRSLRDLTQMLRLLSGKAAKKSCNGKIISYIG